MSNQIPYQIPSDADAADIALRLQNFTATSERGPPVRFVGRENICERISRRISLLPNTAKNECFTEIIQGAPGVGKTSLLGQLQADHELRGVLVVRMESENLSNRVSFVETFLTSLGESIENIGKHAKTKTYGFSSSIFKASLGREVQEPSLAEKLQVDPDVWKLILERLSRATGTRSGQIESKSELPPVLLLIDEAQGIDPDPNSRQNSICVNLHKNHTGELRIMPVFAGLGDTIDVLGSVGISRLGHPPIQMNPLSRDESRTVVEAFLNDAKYGLVGMFSDASVRRISTALAVASEGYPRHLHCYMQSLANEIHDGLVRPSPKGSIDLDEALDAGHRNRIWFCHSRLSGARLHIGVEHALRKCAQSENPETLDYPAFVKEAMNGQFPATIQEILENLARAVHTGVLLNTDNSTDEYHYPIPSFATFMSEGGDVNRVLRRMRESHLKEMARLTN